MCGRLGSTLTVCASPMWLVSPISTGSAGFVTSTISRPPAGAEARPATPWSWQRPSASVASTMIWASCCTAEGLKVLRIVPPFGEASASCWRPSAALGFDRQEADGCEPTYFGSTAPFSVSCTIVWPPPFGPTASVPAVA